MKQTCLAISLITLSLIFPVNAAMAPKAPETSKIDVISRLIYCESGGQNVAKLDSNGKYSYGVLQIQLDTWNQWAKQSGLSGEPMNKNDAVKMAKWAIQNGYIKHWTEWEYGMGLQNKCKWQR